MISTLFSWESLVKKSQIENPVSCQFKQSFYVIKSIVKAQAKLYSHCILKIGLSMRHKRKKKHLASLLQLINLDLTITFKARLYTAQ